MKKIGMIVAVEMKAVLERYGTPQEEKEYPGYRVLVYEAEDYIIYALNCRGRRDWLQLQPPSS